VKLRDRSLLVFAAALAVYAAGAATTVQGGDAGEFMTLAALGGVAHPPGYPLFTGLLRLCGALPLENVAWKASLAAALLGAGALALTHRTVTRLTGDGAAGWIAAGALGLSADFWRYATVAEVFAGGAFTAALVVSVAAAIAPGWRGPRAQLALGLAVATGIANHHTVVLLAPLAFWAWAAALSRPLSPGRALAESAICAAGLSAGFAAYLPLLLAPPDGAWAWGDTGTVEGLVHHFLRRDYGTFQLALAEVEIHRWDHPLVYLARLPGRLYGVHLALALVGAAIGLRGGRAVSLRGFSAALLASWALAGPVFLSRFNVPTEGMGMVVATRFHILPTTLLAVFVGLGAAASSARLRARLFYPGLALVLAAQLAAGWGRASHARWTVLEDYTVNALGAVAPRALVVGASDNFFFSALYAQRVLGLRPDVVFVHHAMLVYPWYRERLVAAHPSLVLEPSAAETVAANLVARPVYLSRELLNQGREAAGVAAWPESAVLMRAAPPGVNPPPPEAVEAQLDGAVAGFRFRSRLETRWQWRETWEAWAVKQYAGTYMTLADAYRAGGDAAGEERCREKARGFAPFWGER
jgi:hypothetical protein